MQVGCSCAYAGSAPWFYCVRAVTTTTVAPLGPNLNTKAYPTRTYLYVAFSCHIDTFLETWDECWSKSAH